MEQKYGGAFSDNEVAKGLGIKVDELHSWKKDMNTVNMLSLDKPMDDSYKQNLYDMLEDEEEEKDQEHGLQGFEEQSLGSHPCHSWAS